MMNKTADYWINKLNLKSHPEGGHFIETYRCEETIEQNCLPERFCGKRNLSTAIYFLLKNDEFSAFHKLQADEQWHFYSGCGLTIFVLSSPTLVKFKLGIEHFQITIKANQWFAAKPDDPDSFSLVGCTMSPGFDFDDFELGTRSMLIQKFPNHEKVITQLTRS